MHGWQHYSGSDVSIPQRSDLNDESLQVQVETVEFQSRNGLIWTAGKHTVHAVLLKFQSRNGLIWTVYRNLLKAVCTEFQSRNGLIWTSTQRPAIHHISSFNPATVWFERDSGWDYRMNVTGFNPATVWFERYMRVVIRMLLSWFQSRNGLIWTRSTSDDRNR